MPAAPSSRTSAETSWRQRVRALVISDRSGFAYRNGGPQNALERAYEMIVQGEDVLDALIAGVNIPESDPEEMAIGYGGLPNADGVVQLDSCCMHGPLKRAGGVAALEGVRMPSRVARAVMDQTDHHLIVGEGAQRFARDLGFEIEDDLNTERSRELWLEWKRRLDPRHWLDPKERARNGFEAGMAMVRDGLIDPDSFWGTINCNGINSAGDICGVTTTSGLSWKIPGRTGDRVSPPSTFASSSSTRRAISLRWRSTGLPRAPTPSAPKTAPRSFPWRACWKAHLPTSVLN